MMGMGSWDGVLGCGKKVLGVLTAKTYFESSGKKTQKRPATMVAREIC